MKHAKTSKHTYFYNKLRSHLGSLKMLFFVLGLGSFWTQLNAQSVVQSVDTGTGYASSGTVDVNDIFTYRLQYTFPSTTAVGLSNVVITDVLPPELQFISLVNSPHATGSFDSGSNTVTFDFGSSVPTGATGELLIRARFPNGTITGTQAVNNATMSGGGISSPIQATPADVTVTALNGDDPPMLTNGVQIVKVGAAGEAYIGSGFGYSIQHGTLGGEDVTNYVIEDQFPDEFIFEEWQHTSPFDANVQFTVDYQTNLNGFTAWPGGPFDSDDNNGASSRHGTDELTLGAGEFVTGLRFNYGTILAGSDFIFSTGATISILGDITTINTSGQPLDVDGNTVTIGGDFTNIVTLSTTEYIDATSSVVTNLVADQAVLGMRKNLDPSGPFTPGQIVEVSIDLVSPIVNVENLVNPTVWDLLPPEMEFVGPITVEGLNNGSSTPSLPNFEAIPDWNGTGRTLLKFYWDASNPYTIQPTTLRTGGTIKFDVQIPFGTADGPYFNQAVGTLENPHICENPNRSVVDVNDFDEDLDVTELLCSGRVANFEVFDDGTGVGLDSQKWVMGECDIEFSRFPDFGNTVPGGVADYELRIINRSSIAVRDIDIIDILPHIGDTGVVDTSPRGTQWEPVLAGPVTFDSGSFPPGITEVTVYYSTSKNPARTNLDLPSIVTDPDDWTTVPPTDITTVKSLRFDIDGTFAANSTQNLVLAWPMRAPLDAPTNGEIAWNSFGFAATNDATGSRLLATEPVKVGFTTKPQNPARYGDYVWFDTNRNGIQEPSESGINGVRVELYSPSGASPDPDNDTLLKFTVTQNDGTADGAYIFSELAAGSYYAVFYPPTGFTASSANQGGDDTLDSDGLAGTVGGNPVLVTGVTTLTATESDLTWDQGFYDDSSGITIGDFVWSDTNENDEQDFGEPGIPGVTVKLIETSSGNEIGSTVTSSDGLYLFGGSNNDNLSIAAQTIASGTENISIAASSDDARQLVVGGANNTGSNDLDLGQTDAGAALGDAVTIGLRFNTINIPAGATITNAYIQFSANNVTGNVERILNGGNPVPDVDLAIYGEAADNPSTFGGQATGPATRTKTTQTVSWEPDVWDTSLERGADQQTPELTSVVQEIVNRSGWSSGNSMVFLVEGTGQREALSYDGATALSDLSHAPELIVEWEVEALVQNTITQGTNYEICIDTTQPALSGSTLVDTGTTDTSNDPNTDLTDSDAVLNGNDAVIAYVGDPDGTFNISLDFGFTGVFSKTDGLLSFLTSNAELYNLDDNSQVGVPVNDPLTGVNTGSVDTGNDDLITDAASLVAAASDVDGDGFSTLLEYALCFDPSTGLKVFPDGSTANSGFTIMSGASAGQLDIMYNRPVGATDVQYTLEQSTNGQTWITSPLVANAPIAGSVIGAEKVTYADILPVTLNSGDALLFRLKVEALDGSSVVATDTTQVIGYQDKCVRNFCETFANPFLKSCLFTGTIGGVTGQDLGLAGSLGGDDLTATLTGSNYYLEVVSGDQIGQRFDITAVTTNGVTIANDSDICSLLAPHNTVAGAAPADLTGDSIVIRQHWTIDELFSPSEYRAGNTINNSAKLIFFDRSVQSFVTLQLDNDPTVGWEDASGNSVGNRVVPSGEGVYTHNEFDSQIIAEVCITQFGEVRENVLNVPLCSQYNLIGAVYPINQSPNGMQPNGMGGLEPMSNSRQMNQDNTSATYTGNGERTMADQIQLWDDDTVITSNTPEVHACYQGFFYAQVDDPNNMGSSLIDNWILTNDATFSSQDGNVSIFESDRSAVICIQGSVDRATNVIPSPVDGRP